MGHTDIYKVTHMLRQAIHSLEAKFYNSSELSCLQKLALYNTLCILLSPRILLAAHHSFRHKWFGSAMRALMEKPQMNKTKNVETHQEKSTESFEVPSGMCLSCPICKYVPLMDSFFFLDMLLSIHEFHF